MLFAAFLVLQAIPVFASAVYLGARDSPKLFVLDEGTNSIVGEIPLPSLPGRLVAAPDGSRVYVALGDDLSLASVRSDDTIEGTIRLSGVPLNIAFSSDSRRAYVTTVAPHCSPDRCGLVDVVDVAEFRLLASVPLPNLSGLAPPGRPCDLALSPDGSRVFVMYEPGPFFVSALDTTSLEFGAPLVLPCCPICAVRVNPDGMSFHIVWGDLDFYEFFIYEVQTLAPRDAIQFPGAPGSFVLSPDGNRAYVTGVSFQSGEARFVTLDIRRGSLVAFLDLPSTSGPGVTAASILALDGTGSRAYISTANPDALLVVDTALNGILASHSIQVGAFSLSSTGAHAYAAGPDVLLILDARSSQISAVLPVSVRDIAVLPSLSTPGPSITATATDTVTPTPTGMPTHTSTFTVAATPTPTLIPTATAEPTETRYTPTSTAVAKSAGSGDCSIHSSGTKRDSLDLVLLGCLVLSVLQNYSSNRRCMR